MSVHTPGSDPAALRAALERPDAFLVACFCAAWCDTCRIYRGRFDELARTRPDAVFMWIDIEDHPEWLGDEDVENFPTLLVRRAARTLFFGPMLPHVGHLERLLDTLDASSPAVATQLPDLESLARQAAARA